MTLESDYSFDANYWSLKNSGDVQKARFEEGKPQKICINSRSDWVIEPMSDCYRF